MSVTFQPSVAPPRPPEECQGEQEAARKEIKRVGDAGLAKIGVVAAQTGVAEKAAAETMGLKKSKDYLVVRIDKVGNAATEDSTCAGAEAAFKGMVAMECAESDKSPLVAGAYAIVDLAAATIAALKGAKEAVAKRIEKLAVNRECPPKGGKKS